MNDNVVECNVSQEKKITKLSIHDGAV